MTDLVTRFSLSQVYRFQISANGERLAIASRESFVVIDLPSRKVVLQGDERSPSLSPRGEVLALVDQRGDLVLTTLSTGARRILRNRWWSTVGVGAWSPDGRFLLTAVRDDPLGFSTNLVAIDCATDKFAEIMRLDIEGDQGERCVWIKRRLLSA